MKSSPLGWTSFLLDDHIAPPLPPSSPPIMLTIEPSALHKFWVRNPLSFRQVFIFIMFVLGFTPNHTLLNQIKVDGSYMVTFSK